MNSADATKTEQENSRLTRSSGTLLCADVGGTRARLVAADLNQRITARRTLSSDELTAEYLASELSSLTGQGEPRAVCVGIAGVISGEERSVSVAPNLANIEGIALKPALQEYFPVPVAVENDVNLAALGEHTFGAGAGVNSMALISLGTGLSAGIIVNGELLRGARDSAGEIGFLSSVQDVTRQPTNVGPLEARVSGAALEQHSDPRTIFERAHNGDKSAQEIVGSVADGLGLAVANLFALVDPELVVLGGWIPRERDLLLDRVREVAHRLAPGTAPVAVAELGDDAALLGAIGVAYQLVNGSRESKGSSIFPAASSSSFDAQL